MSETDHLLENARAFASGFDHGGLPSPPSRRVAIVACMDARLDPAAVLGLAAGDAHVIRNAGGVVTDDVIRSLAISQRLLGTDEVVLIHHTGCGMLSFTDDEFRDQLQSETGVAPTWDAGTFRDLDADVLASIDTIRSSPFVPDHSSVRGFVYSVDDGTMREVSSD